MTILKCRERLATKMGKNTAVNLGAWAALVGITAIGMTILKFSSLRLGLTTKTTQGRVIQHVPEQHQSYRYLYSVNGQSFQGLAMAAERRLGDIKLGESVTVFYDERQPSNSTLTAPHTVFVAALGLIIAACAVVPVVLMCILHAQGLLPPCRLFQQCRQGAALN